MTTKSKTLSADVRRRALFLIDQHHTTAPVNWGDGWQKRRYLDHPGWHIYISLDNGRGLNVSVISDENALLGDWNRRVTAFSERDISGSAGYINCEIIEEIVMPSMQRAMILDDLAAAGGSSGEGSVSDSAS